MQLFFRALTGRKLSYQIDSLIISMLVASTFDVITTYVFISRRLGVENNALAARLFEQSLIWIPLYTLLRPLLVPLLPKIPRRAFTFLYLVNRLSCSANNLSGIFSGRYFLDYEFGFWMLEIFCIFIFVIFFVDELQRHSCAKREKIAQVQATLAFLGLIGITEAGFYLLDIFTRLD